MSEIIEKELVDALLTPPATTKWKAYTEYRDLGFEWLEQIPIYWQTKRLKYAVRINPDALADDTDANYSLQYVDIGNVDSNGAILNTQVMSFEAAPSRARRIVKHGDIIISTVRTYLRAISYIENPLENLIVSTGFAVLRPETTINAKFLWRLIQSDEFVNMVVSYSEGVSYPAITPNALAGLTIWLPSFPEQRTITAFLDRETAQIDALTTKKEQLIQLLQEKRVVLISQAVTRGLDPDVPMKDSGVEWLGEIPEHWYLVQLRRVVRLFVDYRGMTPEKVPSGVPLITARNIKRGDIDFSESQEFIREEDYPDRMRRGMPSVGDVLITTEAPLGETAQIIEEKVALAQRIILLKLEKDLILNG